MSLRSTIAKELHAPARKRFTTRPVEVKGINDLYQADLVELNPYAKYNKGYKYLLTLINCFSKFAFAVPLKNKTATEVVRALTPILKLRNCNMQHLQTDNGKEFYNSEFTKLMNNFKINHYSTYSEKKGAIIERFNRSLKSLMFKRFTESGNYNWLKYLPSLLYEYNHRKHRTIGMSPVQVNKKNEHIVRENINKNRQKYKLKDKKINFKVGDRVRISKYKKIFDKGYLPNWTNEIFTIHRVLPTLPPTYSLIDHNGELIRGTFYKEELKRTKLTDIYLVEKIIKKKGNKLFVKWLGFDGVHNSWINKQDLL